ncbi:DoxX-like family protein [Tenuibacillus multivorans]|uniref:DoxX-like family protein n=1 Tax=Tenuibacillus multivorans TaxID=237069 RepID=A0A1H0AQF3_9BACI|nr:DoxX-like family protein [Tenuibacillus multivorans]GEL77861.1 membrane protein [Tenuibacillus multivorans]SDN35758.1 DoxX-like family protein [Tenuibacillus multivorans]
MVKNPIYVEIPIRAEMDKLWDATQTPNQHEQWDLRFSSITYLPKEEDEPQRFHYKTNIGFGIAVEGWGESVGTHGAKDGSKTSSLHFGTDQKISLIEEGRGYWKYNPQSDGTIQFLTQYDYDTRWGLFGCLVDKVFRPMMGWGTALSFDVVRRWLEKGEAPAHQYIRFFSTWLIALLFSFVWIYHGLVPKLLFMHPVEISMTTGALSLTDSQAIWLNTVIGSLEILFGLLWLFYRQKRHLFVLQLIAFPLLALAAIMAELDNLTHPFNPLTFNLALVILSAVGLMVSKDVPTARHCKRKRH